MVVIDATYQPDGSIFIDFSKTPDLTSITQQNVYILASSTVTGTVSASANPNTIVFYPQISLNNPPIPLS